MFCYKTSNGKSLVSTPTPQKKLSRLPIITPAAHNESPSQATHALPSKYPIYPQRIQAVQPHTSCLLSHRRMLNLHSLIFPNVCSLSLPSVSSMKQEPLTVSQSPMNPWPKIWDSSSKDQGIVASFFTSSSTSAMTQNPTWLKEKGEPAGSSRCLGTAMILWLDNSWNGMSWDPTSLIYFHFIFQL